MARVEALCISEKKGERKSPVSEVTLRAGYGIEGDAHAGSCHRQVSLLAAQDIESVRRRLPDIAPGDFAENVVVSGLSLNSFGLGTRVRLGGDVILSVTQIGKVCHSPCRIGQLTGDCIMPRVGIFTRVEAGGTVSVGAPAEAIEVVPREQFQAVVLTMSDRCSRGEASDTAGPAVRRRLEESLKTHIYKTAILPDEYEIIRKQLLHCSSGHNIDLIVTVGGTGFTPRDVTPEATRSIVKRLAPGLDEAMRAASLVKTPHGMLSRGVSGMRGATLIVNLPGSERAALENLEVILPALPHALAKLRGDTAECGRPPAQGGRDA